MRKNFLLGGFLIFFVLMLSGCAMSFGQPDGPDSGEEIDTSEEPSSPDSGDEIDTSLEPTSPDSGDEIDPNEPTSPDSGDDGDNQGPDSGDEIDTSLEPTSPDSGDDGDNQGPDSGDDEDNQSPDSGDEIDPNEPTSPDSGDELTLSEDFKQRAKGSCNAISAGSTCVEYIGSYWGKGSNAAMNCSGGGVFSKNSCPRPALGGCNVAAGSANEIVTWHYSYGGDPYTEVIPYATQACNALPGGHWIN